MLSKEQLLLNIVKEGTSTISNLLLANYKKIGLNEQEMMLIIHLLYFQSKGDFFPSIHDLEKRMTLSTEDIMRLLQRLVRQGYIFIEENNEKVSGKISEIYNLNPIFLRIIKAEERNFEVSEIKKDEKEMQEITNNIFKVFEQEFGRPLSPMEIELINTWIDNDKYNDEIILFALKEAVFANKLNFRYIDRILFEWQKKNLRSIQQIKNHIKSFRRSQEILKENKKNPNQKQNSEGFEFYNWLEESD